ncbi:hypothetical protein ACIRRA_08425 [Nocardia sp. NPDC101769]|uniref:hypothetical protein n=1 Tax=Nocardia sp. NPDC101769 TaxID=3364333 RepID=UPI00380A75A4
MFARRGIFVGVLIGAATLAGGGAATAAPLAFEPAPTSTAATPVGLDGPGTGSAGPGSILCWLLHPSATCQI